MRQGSVEHADGRGERSRSGWTDGRAVRSTQGPRYEVGGTRPTRGRAAARAQGGRTPTAKVEVFLHSIGGTPPLQPAGLGRQQ
ncbi:hypothetical protein SY2F82_41250 [Streptomyces sp. Y2F8-2]|nr:hypothetical protein SY2F82_41250 [Streptomyces sp. Y2F8-2]